MREIIHLVAQMAPFLLLGFGLAGLMHAFVPTSLYRRFLGGDNFRSVVNAALLGIPLPLCSCGVIPTAMSLRKEGASKGATVSFLTATPQTGVDSIVATYSLLGLAFAVIRPIAALLTALLAGGLVCLLGRRERKGDSRSGCDAPQGNPKGNQCCGSANDTSASTATPTTTHTTTTTTTTATTPKRTLAGRLVEALRYAYVEMMQDIGKTLFVGLVVAGIITVLIPADFFATFADHSLLSMLIVLVASIPMYLCATGSIPIAVALMLKGLTPGAAFVLLMAGPAANMASVMVVGKVLGRRTLLTYLGSIVVGAIGTGLVIDHLMPREWFTAPLMAIESCHSEGLGWFRIACTILFVVLLAYALITRHLGGHPYVTPVATPTRRTLHIDGLRCNKCRANAERALAAVEGVEEVTIELSSGEATIVGTASIEALRAAIEPLGFTIKE